jgi:uracil-DNA glycosylase
MYLKRKAAALPANDAKKPKANGSIASFLKPVVTVSSTTTVTVATTSVTQVSPPAASTWDKEAWVKKLSDEQRQLLALEIATLHDSWLKELRDEVTSESFLNLKRFLRQEAESGKKIFPPSQDVYSWFVCFYFTPYPLPRPLPPQILCSSLEKICK